MLQVKHWESASKELNPNFLALFCFHSLFQGQADTERPAAAASAAALNGSKAKHDEEKVESHHLHL